MSVVDRLRTLRSAGPREQIPAVFADSAIEAWFGLPPAEVREILEAAPDDALRSSVVSTHVLAFLRGEHVPLMDDVDRASAGAEALRRDPATLALAVLGARVTGQHRTALALLSGGGSRAGARNLFADAASVSGIFLAVQAGITRMLAGRYRAALADFERAKWTRPPAELRFLVRDAHVKSAIIHAVLGDPEDARRELADAAAVERTASWAEHVVDASAGIAAALVDDTDATTRLERVRAIPRPDIGEMWPFYVLALTRIALADPSAGIDGLLANLRAADPPGADGDGLPGAVFDLAEAALALSRGHVAVPRDTLPTADAQAPLNRLLAVALALAAGEPGRARTIALRLAPHTAGLRQAEMWRLTLLALAHRALDEPEAAQRAGDRAHALAHGLPAFDLAVAAPVGPAASAGAMVADWPVLAQAGALTARERELLPLLLEGLPRRDIAQRLFVSENTVKTQISSIYRKFRATSRDDFLSEAHVRGLL
ncbi:LuxR C-terminal-related transcriptional regulator [Microbacterium sp. zg.Y1090]|uniref:LuxR C-terminal-related transcriptional regulator n=1 Tax=Microbacterium wangruii TaxID=3049073 RepID=UPI00214AAC19|nr:MULTISPECIES: LuxR C-terminal-related transcriptional regulator [unclassified Microbacterium]MCR2817849.1 LuxR C-terminal-related transcriptional regulator [Microbacterium sp. zg.Y1090]WIM28679.1 LuxR C-terminal-related transcriptional regulator [Microbacterium sp. zg-Y1090]